MILIQSKQAEVFDLMQNWCIFSFSLFGGFLFSFLSCKKKEQSIIAMLSLTTIAKVDLVESSHLINTVEIFGPNLLCQSSFVEYTNSLVNTDSFYSNFSNTTF